MTRGIYSGFETFAVLIGEDVHRRTKILLISDVLVVAESLGFSNVKPVVLSDAGNLLVHLSPFPVVARVAKLFPGDDARFWRDVCDNEIKVARHLIETGIPVVSYFRDIPPRPYCVGDTGMTLWDYVESTPIPTLSGEQAVAMLNDLVRAMSNFPEPLPPLGAWRNAAKAAENLSSMRDDGRMATLLRVYKHVDEKIQSEVLYPAHGDAHPGNLLASKMGWQWIDFEDVSLMPKFWDLASFVGNTALFHGFNHAMVQTVLRSPEVSYDRLSFQMTLEARVILSTMTNWALAVNGHGDWDFAQAQLQRIDDFLWVVDHGSLWRD